MEEPRCCWALQIVQFHDRLNRQGVLVDIEPPLPAGLSDDHCDVIRRKVVLLARHEGFSVTAITTWPMFVYVLVAKIEAVINSILLGKKQNFEDFSNVAWAGLYQSRDKALEA